jgi:hypothetical protein
LKGQLHVPQDLSRSKIDEQNHDHAPSDPGDGRVQFAPARPDRWHLILAPPPPSVSSSLSGSSVSGRFYPPGARVALARTGGRLAPQRRSPGQGAEARALRGPSMDGRHRFIAIVANDAFGLGNPNTVEATMSEHVELFDAFFKAGDTDTEHVFIAYQPRLQEDDQGKQVRAHPPAAPRTPARAPPATSHDPLQPPHR